MTELYLRLLIETTWSCDMHAQLCVNLCDFILNQINLIGVWLMNLYDG